MLNSTTGRGKNPLFTDRIHANPVQQGLDDFVRMRQLTVRQQEGDSPLVYPRAENRRFIQPANYETVATEKPQNNKGGRPRKATTKEEREAARAAKRQVKIKRTAKENAQHKAENPCQFVVPDLGLKTIYKVFQIRSNQARLVDDFTRWSDRRPMPELENTGNEIVKIAGEYYLIRPDCIVNLETGEELVKPLTYSYLEVVYYNMQPDFWVDADGNELDFAALQASLIEQGQECEPVKLADFGEGKSTSFDNLKTGSEGLTGKLSKASQRKIMERLDTFVSVLKMVNRKIRRKKGGKSFRYAAFVTLTLPAEQRNSDKELKEIALKPFMQWLRDKFNVINYLWKAETQKNGRIHFHIVIDRFVHRDHVRDHWNKIMDRLGYVEEFAQAQRAKFTDENGELKFSYTEKELQEQIKRVRERRKKGDANIKLDRTGIKGFALKQLEARFEKAKAANFRQPPSVDVQGLSDMSNAVAYLAKYFSKNGDDDLENADNEEKGERERSKIYRSVEGRLWDCSKDVKALKPFRKVAAYAAQTDTGQFLRRTVDICILDFLKFMDNTSKLRGVENGGVRKVAKDYFTNYITKKRIAHYLIGRFLPLAYELDNYYIQIYRWMYEGVEGFEDIQLNEVPENQQSVKIDPELEAEALKELEALKNAEYQAFDKQCKEEVTLIDGKLVEPELPEIALRREVKKLAYKAKREEEWQEAAQKIELEEARLKATRTADQERAELLRLLIPTEERTYFTSCKAEAPKSSYAGVSLHKGECKSITSIDFRATRYDLTGFEGVTQDIGCPF